MGIFPQCFYYLNILLANQFSYYYLTAVCEPQFIFSFGWAVCWSCLSSQLMQAFLEMVSLNHPDMFSDISTVMEDQQTHSLAYGYQGP